MVGSDVNKIDQTIGKMVQRQVAVVRQLRRAVTATFGLQLNEEAIGPHHRVVRPFSRILRQLGAQLVLVDEDLCRRMIGAEAAAVQGLACGHRFVRQPAIICPRCDSASVTHSAVGGWAYDDIEEARRIRDTPRGRTLTARSPASAVLPGMEHIRGGLGRLCRTPLPTTKRRSFAGDYPIPTSSDPA